MAAIRRADILIPTAVFISAMAVRLLYLADSSDNPTFKAPIVDSFVYDGLARSLVSEHRMDEGFFWQPFFYPFFLSIVYYLSGCSILWAKVIQSVLGAATCLLTYLLAVRIFERRTAIIAAAMTTFYGPLIFIECELLGEGWATFWSVALVLVLLITRSAMARWPWYLLGGLLSGLGIITRPTFVPFVAWAGIWLAITLHIKERVSWSAVALRLTLATAGFVMVIAPVTLQRQRITGQFGLLPESGPLNVYIGNNPNPEATLRIRPGVDWDRLCTLPEKHGATNPAEKQKYYSQAVLDYAIHEPLAFAHNMVDKICQFFSSREIPRNTSIYLYSTWSRFLALTTWRVGSFGFPFGVLLPLALLGLITDRRRIPAPLIAFLLLHSMSVILVFVSGRYRVPMVPGMSILAATGLVWIGQRVPARDWRGIAAGLALIAAVAITSSLPGPFCMETQNYEAELYHCLGNYYREREGNLDHAARLHRLALKLQPDLPDAHNNLGKILADQGALAEASSHYREALRLRPDYAQAHNNLGAALADQGQYEEAIRHYRRALEIKPAYAPAHNNLANSLADTGKLDEAIEHYQLAMRQDRKYAEPVNGMGTALFKKGRIEEAIAYYKRALELKPDYATACNNLGFAYARQGNADEAIRYYERALQLNPNMPETHNSLGVALAYQGKLDAAILHFRQALQLKPDYAEARDNLSKILAVSIPQLK